MTICSHAASTKVNKRRVKSEHQVYAIGEISC